MCDGARRLASDVECIRAKRRGDQGEDLNASGTGQRLREPGDQIDRRHEAGVQARVAAHSRAASLRRRAHCQRSTAAAAAMQPPATIRGHPSRRTKAFISINFQVRKTDSPAVDASAYRSGVCAYARQACCCG
jgi:hypothetical protein